MLAQTTPWIAGSPGTASAEAVRDIPPRAKKSPPLRVLVVDDEPLLRWSVAETLGPRGYEVIEAETGDSAIRALMDAPGATDAVLLDLRLPDFSDLSLLAVMRQLAPSTPIILMTAYGTPELVDRAHHLGAFIVVNKPFEMNDLAPLVDRAVAGSRPS
jgi:two-component system response regulator AtoC